MEYMLASNKSAGIAEASQDPRDCFYETSFRTNFGRRLFLSLYPPIPQRRVMLLLWADRKASIATEYHGRIGSARAASPERRNRKELSGETGIQGASRIR